MKIAKPLAFQCNKKHTKLLCKLQENKSIRTKVQFRIASKAPILALLLKPSAKQQDLG